MQKGFGVFLETVAKVRKLVALNYWSGEVYNIYMELKPMSDVKDSCARGDCWVFACESDRMSLWLTSKE